MTFASSPVSSTVQFVGRWRRRVRTAVERPAFALRRLSLLAYELAHPGEPWISAGATRFCDGYLRPSMRALEWGSGRSTLWFAERVAHLTSVEHDAAWYHKIEPKVRALRNVDYRWVPLDHPVEALTHTHYETIPGYVRVASEFADLSLDLVMVDGHYRQACVRAALAKLARGGILLIDNYNWLSRSEWGVPAEFELVHLSTNTLDQTALFKKP